MQKSCADPNPSFQVNHLLFHQTLVSLSWVSLPQYLFSLHRSTTSLFPKKTMPSPRSCVDSGKLRKITLLFLPALKTSLVRNTSAKPFVEIMMVHILFVCPFEMKNFQLLEIIDPTPPTVY
uniref:Uncharacterized protein n=1 Tax=Cacopsylla melanoneura TaxID=428564 RepID=A0A8D8XI62_9HEMI